MARITDQAIPTSYTVKKRPSVRPYAKVYSHIKKSLSSYEESYLKIISSISWHAYGSADRQSKTDRQTPAPVFFDKLEAPTIDGASGCEIKRGKLIVIN